MGTVILNSIYKYPKECLNTKSSKLHGTEHDQHVINYREAFFFQNQIQFRYQPGIKCLCVTFIHHFVKSFSGTFYLTLFFQGITESMLSFQHLNQMHKMFRLLALKTTSTPALLIKRWLLALFQVLAQLKSYFKWPEMLICKFTKKP